MTVALIIVGIVVAAFLLLGVVSVIDQHARREAVDLARQQVHREQVSCEYRYAWEALQGLPSRLALLAEASEQIAGTYRGDVVRGAPVWHLFIGGEHVFEPPAELKLSSAHPGQLECWQALHRALQRLAAVHQDDDPGVQADAHEQVAIAARELADVLAEAPMPIDLDHCWFCDRSIADARLIANEHAAICDECVQDCYETLLDR